MACLTNWSVQSSIERSVTWAALTVQGWSPLIRGWLASLAPHWVNRRLAESHPQLIQLRKWVTHSGAGRRWWSLAVCLSPSLPLLCHSVNIGCLYIRRGWDHKGGNTWVKLQFRFGVITIWPVAIWQKNPKEVFCRIQIHQNICQVVNIWVEW